MFDLARTIQDERRYQALEHRLASQAAENRSNSMGKLKVRPHRRAFHRSTI